MKNFVLSGSRRLKAVLSLIIAAALIVGTLNFGNVTAKAGSDPVGTPASTGIVGYAKLDDNGGFKVIGTKDSDAVVTADGITASKTIAASKNGGYDVTLKVETSKTVTSNKAAIVLVLDYSGSMDDKAKKAISNAAKTFISDLKKDAPNTMVAVVAFGTKAHTFYPWNAASKYNTDRFSIDFARSYGSLTNTDAALELASNLLKMDSVKGFGNKNVILFTDGQPTVALDRTDRNYVSNNTDVYSEKEIADIRYRGWTTEYLATKTAAEPAKKTAAALDADIYSVYYGDIVNSYIYKDKDSYEKNKAGGYTVKEFLESFSKSIYSTQKTSDFATIFTKALQDIISGSDGKGWKITDPMGQFITYSSSNTFGLTEGTLTWNLSDTTPATRAGSKPGETIYTYTYTYHIDLDTSAEGFVDGQYPANGKTFLSYDGKTLDLIVPVLEGTAPTYVYSVEYYKKSKTTGSYELDSFKSGPVAAARIHSVKTASDIDSNYADTYENYTFNSSKSTTSITVGAVESRNVIKLYFDPVTVQIPVEINYIDITAQNTRTTVHQDTTSSTGFKGDAFTYSYTDTKTWGGHQYTFTVAGSVTSIAEVKGDGSDKIVLNYERETRSGATISIEKNYITHTFAIDENTGRYIAVDTAKLSGPEQIGTGMSTDSYTLAADYDEDDWKVTGITFNGTAVEAGSTQTLVAGANTIRVTYERTDDWKPLAEVKVTYVYQYTKYTVDENGVLQSSTVTNTVGPLTDNTYRVGEIFTATDVTEYNGKTYTAASDNAYTKEVKAEGTEFVLNYYGEAEYPEGSTVTVNHIYQTETIETVVVTGTAIDGITEVVIGTTTKAAVTTDNIDTVNYPAEGKELYKGQLTEISLKPVEGYSFNSEASDDYTNVKADGQTINLYYLKSETEDNRDNVDIRIDAKYYVSGLEIVDGEVVSFTDRYEGSNSANGGGAFVGDSYAISDSILADLASFEGNTYTLDEDCATSIAYVQNGTNVISLKYIRNIGDSALEAATVTVTNAYRTWNMTVQNGVAGYYAAGIVTDSTAAGTFTPAAEKYYKGQRITVADGATTAYAEADSANPAFVQTLEAGSNSFTYNYNRRTELPTATVKVTSHYTLNHINEDGSADDPVVTSSTTETFTKYVGESFTGNYVLADGFNPSDLTNIQVDDEEAENATITVSENGNTIDFFFNRTVDDSVRVDYEINHVYRTYNWDNSLLDESSSKVTGTAFKTNRIYIAPDTADGLYELVEVAAASVISCDGNAEELKDVTLIEVVLSAEKAVIVLNYECYTDTRIPATVIINHHYSAEDTYTSTTTDEGTDVVTMYGTLENGWLGGRVYNGSVFTFGAADERPVYGEKTYTLTAVSPASVTAHEGTPEVIDAYYTRSFSSYVPHDDDIIIVVPSTKFTVTFRDYDETFLGSDTVEKGEAATAPADPTRAADDNYTYTFAGWDKDFSHVISDMTVYATYTPHEIEVVDIIEDEDVPEGEPEIEVEDEVEPTPEVEPEVEVEEVIDIEEPEVPEADLPKTGTLPVVLFFCAGAACIGFGGFVAVKARKKDEKEA